MKWYKSEDETDKSSTIALANEIRGNDPEPEIKLVGAD